MLNQYTLNFINYEQQLQYIQWNASKIVKEHLNSTIYLLSFALISMVQFILDFNISYIVICGISCVVVIYLHKYITKKPQKVDYVISFYQIFALIVMEIDTFLPSQEKTRSTFAWSYGYQTCFIHFCLYLQGTNFIWSTIVLFLVNSGHISLFTYYPSYSIPIIVSFFFMFICMTAVKYNYERGKKEEFFNYTQLEQWETIIQKSISNTMILIRFDKAQDQLRLVKQSIKSQQMHQIHDCYDLRLFLRNLIEVKSLQKLKSLDPSLNLERYIRKSLFSMNQKFQNQIYVDQISKFIYEVKFSKFILNNEHQGLVILDKVEASNSQLQNTQMLLFNEIQMKMGQLMKHQLCQIMVQNIKTCKNRLTNQIRENYNLQATLFYLQIVLNERKQNIKEQITHSKLFSYLQQVFVDKCSLTLTQPFYLQYDYILSIIVTCSKLVEYTEGYLPQFSVEFKSVNSNETQMIICYNFSTHSYKQKIYSLLKTHKISYNSRQFERDTVYENCIGHLCNLKQQYNLPLLLLFDICAMQILLSQVCQYNYMHIEQNPLKLQCTFYNLK